MHPSPLATVAVCVLLAGVGLSACSTTESSTASTVAPSSASSFASPTGDAADLCASFVTQSLTVDAATAAAEDAGYEVRLGNVDGEQRALTEDYRENRLTFDTQDGIVIACVNG